MLGCQLHNTY